MSSHISFVSPVQAVGLCVYQVDKLGNVIMHMMHVPFTTYLLKLFLVPKPFNVYINMFKFYFLIPTIRLYNYIILDKKIVVFIY